MKLLIVCILLIYIVPSTARKHDNHIKYNGTITCKLKSTWCATIYYWEWDFISDDFLNYVSLHCTRNHDLHHLVTVLTSMADWELLYRPYMQIYHDCYKVGQYPRIDETWLFLPSQLLCNQYSNEEETFKLSLGGRSQNLDRGGTTTYKAYNMTEDPLIDKFLQGELHSPPEHLFKYKSVPVYERYGTKEREWIWQD